METQIIVALSLTLLILLLVTWKNSRARRKNERLIQETLKALKTQISLLQNTQVDSFLRQQVNQLKNMMNALLQNNQSDVLAGIFQQKINVLADVARQVDELEVEILRLKRVRSALADHDPPIDFRNPIPLLHKNNPYWKALSDWIREERQWTCEKCDCNLKGRKTDLHAHHIWGRGFNSPQHLKVLCRACHAEELGHAFMKAYPEYEAFLRWRDGVN